jgi:uncharacterized membrane protein YtjA (UPF0391 family)
MIALATHAALRRSRRGTFRRLGISIAEGSAARTQAARPCSIYEVTTMLNLVVTLLIIALIAAVLGFGGIASTAVGLAKVVFFVALLLFLIAAVFGTMRGPRAL